VKAVIKIDDHTKHTLTRESGNRLYKQIREFLSIHPDVSEVIFDFDNVKDVSTSFIQSTVLKLSDEVTSVKLINYNKAVRFKITTLINISNIDPSLFKKADRYPRSFAYI